MDAVERATAALESSSASTGYLSPTEPWCISMIEPPLKQFKLPPLPMLDLPSSPHVSLSTLKAEARSQHDQAYRDLLRQQQVQPPQELANTERRYRVQFKITCSQQLLLITEVCCVGDAFPTH